MDWSHKVGGIHGKRNWPAKVSAKQGLIVRFVHGDGKAGGKMRNTTNLPAICQHLRSIQFVERQAIVIADDEIVGGIESGQSAAQLRIDGVDLLAVTGSQVQGLTERISEERLQPAAGVPPVDLERVVCRVPDIDEVRVVPEGDRWPAGQRNNAVRARTNELIQRCAGAAHHRSAGQRKHVVFKAGSTTRQFEAKRGASRIRRERQE